jgi:LmeA-like phospholipid-binding
MSADPTQPLPEWRRTQGPVYSEPPTVMVRRRRRRRGPLIALITLIVLIVLFVVSDRVANAYAENQMASQFQSSLGLSGKPHVTIQGFPFWTQLIAKDFNQVDITASNETINSVNAGGGALEISSLNATLHGLHFQGFNSNSATVDQFNATALITFTALGNVGGIPQGVTLTPDGPNQVKATLSLGPLSASAVAQVTQSGPNQIHVHITNFGGIPADQLGNFGDFTITIPKLPPGVTIQNVSVTQQGLKVTITGHDTTLSQNS